MYETEKVPEEATNPNSEDKDNDHDQKCHADAAENDLEVSFIVRAFRMNQKSKNKFLPAETHS